MPLLFLVTYIVISYFIFKKNKNNVKDIPFIIKLTGIIAFTFLFLFIIYYSEQNVLSKPNYVFSFYLLLIGYLITFIVYLFKYKKIIIKNNLKLNNDKGTLEKYINNIYFITIISLSLLYFLYSDKGEISRISDGLELLLYLFFILSGVYVVFEKKILNLK